MKLDDFLKCKKVRCLSNDYDFNEQGKAYKLHGLRVFITDETGCTAFLPIEDFEPVLDSVENPLQDMKLTPEFETEASEPKFEVGDKVYFPNMAGGEILMLLDNKACHYPFFVNVVNAVNNSLYELDSNGKTKYGNFTDFAVKATHENYEMLCKLYPHIEFEQPNKELTGSDLARAMLDNGWKYVPCYVSNYGESEAQKPCIVRKFSSSGQFVSEFGFYNNAVPFDPKTGESLTKSVLND